MRDSPPLGHIHSVCKLTSGMPLPVCNSFSFHFPLCNCRSRSWRMVRPFLRDIEVSHPPCCSLLPPARFRVPASPAQCLLPCAHSTDSCIGGTNLLLPTHCCCGFCWWWLCEVVTPNSFLLVAVLVLVLVLVVVQPGLAEVKDLLKQFEQVSRPAQRRDSPVPSHLHSWITPDQYEWSRRANASVPCVKSASGARVNSASGECTSSASGSCSSSAVPLLAPLPGAAR